MKRLLVFLCALAFSIIGFAPAAHADSPHFIGTPTATVSGQTLTVTASIAGLGKISAATFSLDGTVTVASRCYTKSGNKPQAANKQETLNVSKTASFPVRAGRTNVSFSVSPLSSLSCPKGQNVVIESVSYDLWLTGEGLSFHIVA